MQEGRMVENNFKETRMEPRKSGPVSIIFRCLLLQDALLSLSADSFRGRQRRGMYKGQELSREVG